MTIRKELIERQSGVYSAQVDEEGSIIITSVTKVGIGFNYSAEAVSTVDRFKACNNPRRVVKDTIDLLIKRIEEVRGYGSARV